MYLLYSIQPNSKTVSFRDNLKICSFNVQGLGDRIKRKSIFAHIGRKKCDICFLQETHIDSIDKARMWETEFGGKLFCSNDTAKAKGVAILIKNNLEFILEKCETDNEGRIVCIKAKIQGKTVVLCNVYEPNSDCPEFYHRVIKVINLMEDKEMLILGGDFNLVMNVKKDRLNPSTNNEKSLAVLQEFMDNENINDIWRIRNPDKQTFTWCHGGGRKGKLSASRIDMMLISASYNDCVNNCEIKAGIHSDHSWVTLELSLEGYERGAGAWKLNTKLLYDRKYEELIKETIKYTIESMPCANPNKLWTLLKINCAKVSKEYSCNLARKSRENIDQLMELKGFLIRDQICNPENEQVSQSIAQINSELERADNARTNSIIFRSKMRWTEAGERNSKMFFSLEKDNYMAKNMKCIITDCGKHIFDQKSILTEQTKFYKSLYIKKVQIQFNLVRSGKEPYLSEEEKLSCDRDLEMGELYDAIVSLKSGKCPGGMDCRTNFISNSTNPCQYPCIKWLSTPTQLVYYHSPRGGALFHFCQRKIRTPGMLETCAH